MPAAPPDVVQAALAAYLDHDLDRCMAFYADDARMTDAAGRVVVDGPDAMRSSFARDIADNPDITYRVSNRIALGNLVIDEERVTGYTKPGSPELVQAILLYRLSGGRIQEIQVLAVERIGTVAG